jgi:hypothetical protein
MNTDNKQIQSWPDLAIGLYEKLNERNAEISYTFEDFSVRVPQRVGSTKTAEWQMNGTLTISTAEKTH